MTTIKRYTKKFVHYLRHNRAVSALEYAILVGAVAVAMAGAMTAFTTELKDALQKIAESAAETSEDVPNGGDENDS